MDELPLPVLRIWARVQAAQGRQLLWLRSDELPTGDLPEKVQVLDLPAPLSDVLSALGAQGDAS